MAEEGLLIPIQFTLEEARSALAQLEAQARGSGQRAGDGLSSGFGKGLAGLKTGMSQSREVTMALTGAIGELGPQGRTAQLALSSLGTIMMGGGILGAGLLAAQAGVRLLVDVWEEEERASKAATAAALEAAAVRAAVNREFMSQANGSIGALKSLAASFKDQTAAEKAHQEVLKINQQLALAQDPTFRQTLERRLDEAKALETLIGKLEGEKVAREAALKAKQDAEKAASVAAQGLSRNKQEDAAVVDRINAELAEEVRAANERAAMRQAEEDAKERAYQREIDHESFLMQWMEDRHQQTLAAYEAQRQALEASMPMDAMRSFTQSVAASFGPVLTRSAAYNRAMKAAGVATQNMADFSGAAFLKMAQDAMAAMAIEAAGRSLFNLALGLSMSAMGNPKAAEAFAASAEFAIVAGMGAAGSLAVGATRGTTKAERAEIAGAAEGQKDTTPAGGPREYFSGTTAGAGGTVTVRETVFIVAGSEFESPAETARRAARTLELVKKLDLERRAG